MKNKLKKTTLILGLFSFLFIVSCGKEEKSITKIATKLDVNAAKSLMAYSIGSNYYDEISTVTDSLTPAIDSSIIMTIEIHKMRSGYVYIKPGEEIVIDTILSRPSILGAVGTISAENTFLNKYQTTYAQLDRQKIYQFGAKEADSFQLELKKLYAPIQILLDDLEADQTMEEKFKTSMRNRILVDLASPYVSYSNYYSYRNDTIPVLPDDFYKEVEAIDFKAKQQLEFHETLGIGRTWATKDIDYNDYESVTAFYAEIEKKLKNTYGASDLGNYYAYQQLKEDIDFGSGIDANAKKIQTFTTNVTNVALNSLLNNAIKPWETLKAGKEAPEFIAQNRDGEDVSSKNLKGKNVYIDVWATWCSPCIAEIPALKQLEHDLADKNIEFVSVSIDKQKDKEKWLKFIEEKELGGLQLMAKGEFQSDVTKNYNIQGIPRFILLDANGNIVNANAPRPSDPNTKEILSTL